MAATLFAACATVPATPTTPVGPPRLVRTAPTPPDALPPSPPPAGPVRPLRSVLFLGDSVMADAVRFAIPAFEAHGIRAHSGAYWGTSLLGRTDVRDQFRGLIAEHDPDVVIAEYSGVYLPPYARLPDGTEIPGDDPRWWDVYRSAAVDATRVLSSRGAVVYWVLLPHTLPSWEAGEPLRMNDLYASLVREFPATVRLIDAVTPFSGPGGSYRELVPVAPGGPPEIVRGPDGRHFNEAGQRLLTRVMLEKVLTDYGRSPQP